MTVLLTVVLVPLTVKSPVTSRFPLMVTLSDPSVVSIFKMAALPEASKLRALASSSIRSQSRAAAVVISPLIVNAPVVLVPVVVMAPDPTSIEVNPEVMEPESKAPVVTKPVMVVILF